MSVVSPIEERIAAIKRETQELEEKSKGIRKARAPFEAAVAAAANRIRYLKFVHWLRSPQHSYPLWRSGSFFVLPATIGTIAFVLGDHFSDSFAAGLLWCAIGITFTSGLLAVFFFCPSDASLPHLVVTATRDLSEAETRLQQQCAVDGLSFIASQLSERHQELRDQVRYLEEEVASGKYRRLVLLQRNWKAMRDDEWEEYLVDVFRALGWHAERTGKCGDQGCDLLVQNGDVRIVVQAKGYHHAVNNKAVQEAVAAVAHYNCDGSAVITNSRFTSRARELAESNCCILISEDEFPDFVKGNINILDDFF